MAEVGGKDNVRSRDRGVCGTSSRLVNRIDASQRGPIWVISVRLSMSLALVGVENCDAVKQVAARRFRDAEQAKAHRQDGQYA